MIEKFKIDIPREKVSKIKGIKEIMYPGRNKSNRFKINSKKEIKISEIIKKEIGRAHV